MRAAIALLGFMAVGHPAVAQPARLAGGEWRVLSIGGAKPPAAANIAIAFLADNRIAGRSGCNRFFGTADVQGERMTFSAIGTTRMACPQPLMAAEARFLDALRFVERWRLQRGTLVLSGPGGRSIRARRLSPPR